MKNPLMLCTLVAALPATAQTTAPHRLDPVVISVDRSPQSSFDAPAAITAVTRETIDAGGPQVNLSEALNRVPGISILNRQNYAQDLQLSIRGFGSRSTFGIRGVRLIVDGIPATMPDGQGQASSVALGSAERIEVLRGPMAQLYGNAAGGVVTVVSQAGADRPEIAANLAIGPWGQRRMGLKVLAGAGTDAIGLEASHYQTDGWREHSEARREQINGKWVHEVGSDTRFSLVVNGFEQPLAQDPAGLVRADFDTKPQTAIAGVKTQDARKSVFQHQIGAVLEHRFATGTALTARVYFGERALDNALSTPPAAQTSNTASGGIVTFTRGYHGLGVQLAHKVVLGDDSALRLTGGVDLDSMNENRQGFVNAAGVATTLKRSERNEVGDRDVFAQAAYDLGAWTATAGVRSSRVTFRSTDFFIKAGAPNNPDDSGGVDYSATNPVLGLTWRAGSALNLYANVGRGFETPTATELAYRNAPATGLNTDLRASRSRHAELGLKWKPAEGHRIDAAVYDIRTTDEIGVDTNVGGRTTFKNAGKTSRKGIELQYLGQLGEDWRATLSLSVLRARFVEAAAPVLAGNRLPGTPERSAFAELAWTPKAAPAGFNAAIELIHVGSLMVNDTNDDAAPAATVVNLRAGFAQKVGSWQFNQLVRVENAANKRYAGSVIVNEANQRYFEPALPRNWLLSMTAKYTFE